MTDVVVLALLLLNLAVMVALLTSGPAIIAFFVGDELGISIAAD